MAVIGAGAAKDAIREHLEPALDAIEENVQHAQRAVAAGRVAVEDLAAEAAEQVRKHPMGAIITAAGIGAAIGCLVGLTFGWGRRGGR
jgi:ElaB/YqjD/DUF883 family membrane-anchored ribosome-binding protein